MILVEERLRELFDTLPNVVVDGSSYKPAYECGSHEDLQRYLVHKRKEGGKMYPLIWLQTPLKRVGDESPVDCSIKLVLATLTKKVPSNMERMELTIKPTLLPVYDNVYKALRMSGFSKILTRDKKTAEIHFNYAPDNNEQGSPDIWDAIKLECEVEFTDCKQRNINY